MQQQALTKLFFSCLILTECAIKESGRAFGWELTGKFGWENTGNQPTSDTSKQLISTADGFCFLTHDSNGSGNPWTHCYLDVSGDYWHLHHKSQSSSSTAVQQPCLARCVTGLMSYTLTEEKGWENTQKQPTNDEAKQLISTADGRFCFLTNDANGSDKPWTKCYLTVEDDYWYLHHQSKSSSSSAFQQRCLARCVTAPSDFTVLTEEKGWYDQGNQPTTLLSKQLISTADGFCFLTNDANGSDKPWTKCYLDVSDDYWYLYHESQSSSSTAWQQRCLARCELNTTFNILGQWTYLETLTGSTTLSETHGTAKTESETETSSWSQSVSKSVSAGLSVYGLSSSATLTTTQSQEYTTTYQSEWEMSEEETMSVTFDNSYEGHALWQWVFDITDPYNNAVTTKSKDFAVTPGVDTPPKCQPGYSVNDTIDYQTCTSADRILPGF